MKAKSAPDKSSNEKVSKDSVLKLQNCKSSLKMQSFETDEFNI